MDILQGLGDVVRHRRKALGLSRRALAGKAQVSERFLAEIEAGRGNPSLLRLQAIAAALDSTPAGLLTQSPVATTGSGGVSSVIALLGLRGAGKSSVGARLAELLGVAFVELDVRIEEAAGLRVGEMFELHGEAYFRRVERQELGRLLANDAEPSVLATGGGLVTEPETYSLLRAGATTVWLRARPEDHWSRVVAQGDTRPMANDDRAFSNLCAILAERERLYEQADLTVDTTEKDAEEIAQALAQHFAQTG